MGAPPSHTQRKRKVEAESDLFTNGLLPLFTMGGEKNEFSVGWKYVLSNTGCIGL